MTGLINAARLRAGSLRPLVSFGLAGSERQQPYWDTITRFAPAAFAYSQPTAGPSGCGRAREDSIRAGYDLFDHFGEGITTPSTKRLIWLNHIRGDPAESKRWTALRDTMDFSTYHRQAEWMQHTLARLSGRRYGQFGSRPAGATPVAASRLRGTG